MIHFIFFFYIADALCCMSTLIYLTVLQHSVVYTSCTFLQSMRPLHYWKHKIFLKPLLEGVNSVDTWATVHEHCCFQRTYFPHHLFAFTTAGDKYRKTKTCLFKYSENFTTKNESFSDKKFWHSSYFCSKHRLWVHVRIPHFLVFVLLGV